MLARRFHRWSIIFAPALLGNAAVFMLPQPAAEYFGNAIVAPIVESAIRRDWPLMRRSRWLQALAFMAISAVVLDTKRQLGGRDGVFWFVEAPQRRPADGRDGDDGDDGESPAGGRRPSPWLDWLLQSAGAGGSNSSNNSIGAACTHRHTCDEHIRSGAWTYLNVGIVMELVRLAFGSARTIWAQPPQRMFGVVVRKMKFRLIAFLVAYATVYRVSVTLDWKQIFIR